MATRQETVYGFFPGGDPREFTPDYESNTQAEIDTWKQACEAWNEAEREGKPYPESLPNCRPLISDEGQYVGHAIHSGLGLGVYTFEWDDEENDNGE